MVDKIFKSIPCQVLAKILSIFLRVKQDIRYILRKKEMRYSGYQNETNKSTYN